MCATTRRKKVLINQYHLRLKQKQPEPKPRKQVIVITFLVRSIPMLRVIFHHSTYESKTPNAYSELFQLRIRMVVTKRGPKPVGKRKGVLWKRACLKVFMLFSPTVKTWMNENWANLYLDFSLLFLLNPRIPKIDKPSFLLTH